MRQFPYRQTMSRSHWAWSFILAVVFMLSFAAVYGKDDRLPVDGGAVVSSASEGMPTHSNGKTNTLPTPADSNSVLKIDLTVIDRARILKAVDAALELKPITITKYRTKCSKGGPNDFYSEADYFWPDPKKPDGLPYINRDGQSNPHLFSKHRMNDTRPYSAGSYNVYARLAAGGGATTCTLSEVTGGWGTTNQTTNPLGTFSVANTAWESYNCIPLKDSAGNLATVSFNGSANTLRLSRPSSATADCNANFLMLVPVFAITAAQTGNDIIISFPTQSGFNYRIQYKNDLFDAAWSPLTTVVGDNTMKSVNDPATGHARFYRAQLQ